LSKEEGKFWRVKIELNKKTNVWSISQNFHKKYNLNNISQLALDLSEISEDWTDYTRSIIEHGTPLSFIGSVIVGDNIENDLVPFLKSESVGHEEDNNEYGKTTYSYIISEQDIPIVQKNLI